MLTILPGKEVGEIASAKKKISCFSGIFIIDLIFIEV